MQQQRKTIFFERRELDQLLSFYGRMVAAGEWRDYAMDALSDRALFSVYRRTSGSRSIRSRRSLQTRRVRAPWSVVAADGRILRRGHDLTRVLAVLEPKRLQLVRD